MVETNEPSSVDLADVSIAVTEGSAPVPLPSESGLEYVGFGRRAAARLIDLAVHLVIGFASGIAIAIFAYVIEGWTGRSAQIAIDRLENGGVQAFLLGMLGGLLYDTIMEGLHGSTVGKLLVGITVLRETARPCTLMPAAKRSLLYFYDALLFGMVAEHSMKQTPTQQRYGDRWADTVVVHRRSAPPASRRSFVRFAAVLILAALVDGAVLSANALSTFIG